MVDAVELQLNEIYQLSARSLTCTVRCLSGPVRVGASVRLSLVGGDRPLAERLTISDLQLYPNVPVDVLDPGMTAIVTATGPIDESALRATVSGFAPEQVVPADLRLVAG